jgi:hypothetical protein
VKRLSVGLMLVSAIYLSGCAAGLIGNAPNSGSTGGSGSTSGGGGTTQPFVLTVAPGTATLRGGTTQQYTATTNDGTTPTFNWTVNGSAGGGPNTGTISATGLYTAPVFPPAGGPVTIGATETMDATKSGTASLTLQNPMPTITAVAPLPINVGAMDLCNC